VHVEEFGIGYPPLAMKLFEFAGTVFTLNWIPFGGFVKLEGEEGPPEEGAEAEVGADKSNVASTSLDQPFYKKSRIKRLAIVAAGAGVNFLFGIVAFSIYFSVKGIPAVLPQPRIAQVAPGSPAAESNIPTDVNITGFIINDQKVETKTADEVIAVVNQHAGEHVTLLTTGHCNEATCDAQNPQQFDVYLRRKDETPAHQGSLGIEMQPVVIQQFFPWPEMPLRGAWYGIQQTFYLSYLILQGLGQLLSQAAHGHAPADVAGPIGIYSQANKAGFFSHGLFELLNFAGILSVNLAIMNVLPFPALDGGRLLFILLEMVIGKKRVQKFEGYANYGGFALLLFLIVIITIKDIGAIILGK